ncbi:MAG TPA: TIGR01777 family oxidoreductase, partial [Verrucomicrobiaceae bacterium]
MNTTRIILAGGGGFLGRVLSSHFLTRGREVTILSRAPKPCVSGVQEVEWDGETVGDWSRLVDGSDAIINLAGRTVNCRYHARNRRLILDSRVNSTRAIGEAIARTANPPRVWLNSSTATIYRHTLGPAWDESGEIGGTPEAKDEFSVEVARAWEDAFKRTKTPATRKAALRSAMVLGRGKNSVFPMLRRLARLGLGGKMGNGRQFVSWIHEEDFCRAIDWLLEHEDMSGVVNLAAPNPVTNAEMMRAFRDVCGIPIGLPATRRMLEVGAFFLRTETELIVKSRRVIPGKLMTAGFEFRFPGLEDALLALERRVAHKSDKASTTLNTTEPITRSAADLDETKHEQVVTPSFTPLFL